MIEKNCRTCDNGEKDNCESMKYCSDGRSRWLPLQTRRKALQLIDAERNRQDAKWGIQNHAQSQWIGILGEEFGEYCQAVNETVFDNGPDQKLKGGYDRIMEELTHVAAVAVGAMECLMRGKEEQNGKPDN